MSQEGTIRRRKIAPRITQNIFKKPTPPECKVDQRRPRLEKKIVTMSIINVITFVVTLKQLYLDVSWNMNVQSRDSSILFSCSLVHRSKDGEVLQPTNPCCEDGVKNGVAKMFANSQLLNEKHVLCFIIIGGLSAFTLLFIIAGFSVGYRSKYRNILMHPIFSVGTFAHLANCFFFILGILLRQKHQSTICNDEDNTTPTLVKNKVLHCLRQVLPCEDIDMNFKYWFIFSLTWVIVGIVLVVFFYQYSKPFLHGMFQYGPHAQSENDIYPVTSVVTETVVPI